MMQDKLNSSNLPTKQRFAGVFRLLGQISYWIHLILGTTAGIILGLIIFSRRLGEPANNSVMKVSIIFTVASLIALGFRIFWAWRYNRLAKQLQISNPAVQPNRAEIIKVLRVGLSVSLLVIALVIKYHDFCQ